MQKEKQAGAAMPFLQDAASIDMTNRQKERMDAVCRTISALYEGAWEDAIWEILVRAFRNQKDWNSVDPKACRHMLFLIREELYRSENRTDSRRGESFIHDLGRFRISLDKAGSPDVSGARCRLMLPADDGQIRAFCRAADLYIRIALGQWGHLQNVLYDCGISSHFFMDRDTEEWIVQLRSRSLPVMAGLSPAASFGIFSPELAPDILDICQMRHAILYQSGGTGVYAFPPLPHSREGLDPLIDVTFPPLGIRTYHAAQREAFLKWMDSFGGPRPMEHAGLYIIDGPAGEEIWVRTGPYRRVLLEEGDTAAVMRTRCCIVRKADGTVYKEC